MEPELGVTSFFGQVGLIQFRFVALAPIPLRADLQEHVPAPSPLQQWAMCPVANSAGQWEDAQCWNQWDTVNIFKMRRGNRFRYLIYDRLIYSSCLFSQFLLRLMLSSFSLYFLNCFFLFVYSTPLFSPPAPSLWSPTHIVMLYEKRHDQCLGNFLCVCSACPLTCL